MAASDIHHLFLYPSGVETLAAAVSLRDFEPAESESTDKNRVAWLPAECASLPCLRAGSRSLCAPVHICGLCPSSFDMANFFLSRDVLPEWASVIVCAQASGRGQLGRSWHSPRGNMYGSLRLPLRDPFDGFAAAPALGAYIVHTLNGMGIEVRLKWPNDIIVMDNGAPRKAGGILLEEREGTLIAGIGLNLVSAPTRSALREGHALEALCLSALPDCGDSLPMPIRLWLRLVEGIKFWYEQVPSPAVDARSNVWRQMAEQYLLYMGVQVNIVDGNKDEIRLRGTVSGLAPDGGLLLCAGSVTHTVHSGSLIPV